ncbi:MAG TPA: histidine phosphatase family protein [Symbiobacteriaceae bacterium]|nr:histidine phosphatase family protein [Symbiobacteriaceae bacterium]
MRILIMRHGESTSDLEPRRIEGMADFPLSAAGLAQAQALARRFASEYELDELISSPLTRARQTAEAVSAVAGVPVRVDERLREKSLGDLGGLTFAEADAQYPGLNWRMPAAHEVLPGGEAFLDQYRRVAGFWFSLRDRAGEDRTVGIVTHGGTIQCLYRVALGLPVNTPHAFLNGDTGLHEWIVEPGGAVKVRKANCTRHLE